VKRTHLGKTADHSQSFTQSHPLTSKGKICCTALSRHPAKYPAAGNIPDTMGANVKVYSSLLLWPAQDPTQMTGGSPIIWTMLHPPSVATRRLQTYAWNGHMENFMPWTIGQTDGAEVRPPLLSYARWNIRRNTDFNSTIDKTTTHSAPTIMPVISRQTGSPGTTIYRLIVAILFPYPSLTHPGLRADVQHPIPTTIQSLHWPWHYPWSVKDKPAKSRKSCAHWIAAIIQLLWHTAWDLLTHRNVEISLIWVWPAHYICRMHPTQQCTAATICGPSTLYNLCRIPQVGNTAVCLRTVH